MTATSTDLPSAMKKLDVGGRAPTSYPAPGTKMMPPHLVRLQTSSQPAGRRQSPFAARLLDQCMPGAGACLPNAASDASEPLKDAAASATPSAVIAKRPNNQMAHMLQLPASVPYAIRVHNESNQGTCHVLPVLTPLEAAFIRQDAEKCALAAGGWKPRAVGCCTNDLLCKQLSAQSQQLIFNAFRRILMPYATRAFPEANLAADSLPSQVECFWIVKYKAGKQRSEFGEHIDHTKLTVNIALTSSGVDYTAGGLFFPTGKGLASPAPSTAKSAAKPSGPTPTGTPAGAAKPGFGVVDAISAACSGVAGAASRQPAAQSKGLVLKTAAGTAVIHHGDLRHAGEKIDTGERMQLIAFFYGGERRGNALPRAVVETTKLGEAKEHAPTRTGSAPRRPYLAKPPQGLPPQSASVSVSVKGGGLPAVGDSRGRANLAPAPPEVSQRVLTLDDIRALAQQP